MKMDKILMMAFYFSKDGEYLFFTECESILCKSEKEYTESLQALFDAECGLTHSADNIIVITNMNGECSGYYNKVWFPSDKISLTEYAIGVIDATLKNKTG